MSVEHWWDVIDMATDRLKLKNYLSVISSTASHMKSAGPNPVLWCERLTINHLNHDTSWHEFQAIGIL